MSPTFLKFKSYRFYVNNREESRKHIHVQTPDGELKIWLEPEVKIDKIYNVKPKEVREILQIVKEHKNEFIKNGKNTSIFEITGITKHGIWFILDDKEYFIPFKDYPMLKRLSVEDLLNASFSPPEHIYWEKNDIDIELSALENPEKYNLTYEE